MRGTRAGRCHLAQADGEIAELLGSRAELGRDSLERREGTLGARGQRGSTLTLLGSDGFGCACSGLLELSHVSKALSPSA